MTTLPPALIGKIFYPQMFCCVNDFIEDRQLLPHWQMDLEDSVEISDLVSKINANPQHLDALLNEADQHGHRDILEGMWMERIHHVHNSCMTNSQIVSLASSGCLSYFYFHPHDYVQRSEAK